MRSYLHSGQCHNPTNSTNYYLSQGHGVGEAADQAEGERGGRSSPPSFLRRDVGPAPRPFPAAPADPAQRRATRPQRARPESAGDRRQRRCRCPGPAASAGPAALLKEEVRRGPGRGSRFSLRCSEGSASPGPLESRKWAAKAQPDAGAIRTLPEAASRAPTPRPTPARSSGPFPPRFRHVAGVRRPRPSPPRARGGGWAEAGPVARAPAAAATRPAPGSGQALRSGERPGRFPQRRTPAPATPIRNQVTVRKSRSHQFPSTLRGNPVRLCRRRELKQKPRKTETEPGGGSGGSGGSSAGARTHGRSRASLLLCVRTNHRDHLRRLARYSSPRDRPSQAAPRAAILHPGERRRPVSPPRQVSTCH